MLPSDKKAFWHNKSLDISLMMHALHVDYAYPPHSHDHYVICMVEWGVPSFSINNQKYISPPRGLIFINPGVVHTGAAATNQGLKVRSLYPTAAHMQQAAFELTGRPELRPLFREVYLDDLATSQAFFRLHSVLSNSNDRLEQEICFTETLVQLIGKHAAINQQTHDRKPNEPDAVRKAKNYLKDRYVIGVTLDELANYVGFSPYYFLRIFRQSVGMSPYEFVRDMRIRQAQALIKAGKPLAQVSIEVGFSSQSHLNRSFKQILGMTPGKYASQIRI